MAKRKHKLKVNETVFNALFDAGPPVKINYGLNYAPNDIRYYVSNGQDFRPVCRIKPDSRPNARNNHSWEYADIDQSILYSADQHWVYAITVDNQIWKWGESLNPLGIRANSQFIYDEPQPMHGTKSRFGRYRTHGSSLDDTDYNIRLALKSYVDNPNHKVEFWARKCTEYHEIMRIQGWTKTITASNNKAVEKFFLDFYKANYGVYPPLNKGRC